MYANRCVHPRMREEGRRAVAGFEKRDSKATLSMCGPMPEGLHSAKLAQVLLLTVLWEILFTTM